MVVDEPQILLEQLWRVGVYSTLVWLEVIGETHVLREHGGGGQDYEEELNATCRHDD